MPDELRDRLEDKTCLHLSDFSGDYPGFQNPENATPDSPWANHPVLYREDDDQEMPVWVNRLTTIRVNEIKVDDLQNLINEVRSYLSNGNIIFPASVEAGRFLHLGEPEASARPPSIR